MRKNRVSSVGGFRNLPRHSLTRGWRYPVLLASFNTLEAPYFDATRRDAIRVVATGAPAPLLRRRGAPAPPPPPRSLRSRPRHGGRGQGRAVVGAIAPPLFFRLTPRVFTSAWPSYLRPRPLSASAAFSLRSSAAAVSSRGSRLARPSWSGAFQIDGACTATP